MLHSNYFYHFLALGNPKEREPTPNEGEPTTSQMGSLQGSEKCDGKINNLMIYLMGIVGESLFMDPKGGGDRDKPPCRYGDRCRDKHTTCVFAHPEETQGGRNEPKPRRKCRNGANCLNINTCTFAHPPNTQGGRNNQKTCRNGDDCRNRGCKYAHPKETQGGGSDGSNGSNAPSNGKFRC